MTQVTKLLPEARRRLVTVRDEASLIEAAELLRLGADIVIVCDSMGRLAGVITKTDVVAQISHCQGASCMIVASSAMTRDVVVCRAEDWLQDVWTTMKKRRLKHIPILDLESRPIGVLNVRDALEELLQEAEDEESLLRDYVMGIGYQ